MTIVRNTEIVPVPLEEQKSESHSIVEYKGNKGAASVIEDEDLEIKLRRILEHVPVRVSNTSGSSAGSGSGDFHQYRQMRRKEQDRVTRMAVDYEKRKEVAEFNARREERLKAAEERTAKKRAKRQKKKEKKKAKKKKQDSSASGQVGGPVENKKEPVENKKDSDGSSTDSDSSEDYEIKPQIPKA